MTPCFVFPPGSILERVGAEWLALDLHGIAVYRIEGQAAEVITRLMEGEVELPPRLATAAAVLLDKGIIVEPGFLRGEFNYGRRRFIQAGVAAGVGLTMMGLPVAAEAQSAPLEVTFGTAITPGSFNDGTNNWTTWTFLASNSFTITVGTRNIQLMIVGGGGGGGQGTNAGSKGGGGGGGGVLFANFTPVRNQLYTVTVGNGGIGGSPGVQAGNGGSSSVGGGAVTLTAFGGGCAGGVTTITGCPISGVDNPALFGSGGGGAGANPAGGAGGLSSTAASQNGTAPPGPASPTVQGTSGGLGSTSTNSAGGGGGGFTVAGAAAVSTAGGAGGAGYTGTFGYAPGGVNRTVAGGGGGGGSTAGSGADGGGTGANNAATATAGTANTGGGGGGERNTSGAAGGSGVVVIRYLP